MMKKIFLFLLLIISFVSYGQTYNPANFTVSNKSYGVAQAVPTDARSQFYDGTNFVMRDYQSTTEVNSYLNLAKYRTGHFLVYIHNGGSLSSGVWTGGTTDIYIYKDGVLDANLVPLFTNTTLSNTGSGFRIVKPISGSDYPLRSLASSNTIIWDSTSNSNSLTGKVDTSLIVTINRLSDTAASIRLAISAGGGGITTLTGDVTASGTGSVAATIANNAVSNAKFRQSVALSVVGRTSNSTGNVADIAAATSGHVLRRNGTTLDFGTIDSVSVPLLHSEAYYNTKYPAIGSDSVYVKNAGDSGLSLFYIQGDTLKFKRINGATQNADSSISVTGGSGGSQTFAQVLATGRTLTALDSINNGGYKFKFKGHLWSDSVIYADYQILGPTPTTMYTMHPLTGTNIIGKIIPTFATYAFPMSGYGNEGGGYPGVWMGGQQALRFGWDGTVGDASLIQGFGTNRLTIQATGTMTHISAVNRFEYEGSYATNPFVTFTGYQAATANTWPILFASDPTTPNTSLGVMGREGELPFAIYNSSYRQKSAFNFRGYLAIGDTSNITAGLTIMTPTVTRGVPAIRLYDSTFNTNYWEIATPYAYSNTDLNFNFNGTNLFGATANQAIYFGAHDPGYNRVSIKGIGNTSANYSLYAKNSSNTFLFGVRDDGEIYIGSETDNGAYKLQNTGGLYQQGAFRLGGTRAATSNDVKLLVKGESDSTVAQLDFPIVQSTYSVTLTNTTNIASSSTNTTYYERRGNVIHVWGTFTAAATAGGSVCEMGFSIPVSSGFTNVFDLGGSGSSDTVPVKIIADATNDRAKFRFTPAGTGSTEYSFHFTYWYIAP